MGYAILCITACFMLVTLFCPALQANDEMISTREGKWAFGLQIGPSFVTQDLDTDEETKGETGIIVNGNLLYSFSETLALGIDFEWERHSVKESGIGIGAGHTFSFIPFIQYRLIQSEEFIPYIHLGLGANMNFFSENDNLGGFSLEPGNTVAVKVAGGLDYYIKENLALNGMLGWKWNSGIYDFEGFSGDFNVSAFSLLFGIRYFFQ